MSRHLCDAVKDGVTYKVAYGYDYPMQEYFIQVYKPDVESDEDEDDGIIVWEGSRMTGKSNGEIIELFEQWNVPEHHINRVALDLPIE